MSTPRSFSKRSRQADGERKRGTRKGLAKAQAEKEMRPLMRELKREVGDAYNAHVRDFLERKPATVQDYEGILNKAERRLPRKTARYGGSDIEGYVSSKKKAAAGWIAPSARVE